MSIRTAAAFVLLSVLAACGPYPRDIEGTTERIRQAGVVRVAFAGLDARQAALAQRYAAAVARDMDARIAQQPPAGLEAQFARLEEGELDLVIAEVAEDSPWLSEVAVLEPLQRRRVGARVLAVSPIARNGENQWIGLLERNVRDLERRK